MRKVLVFALALSGVFVYSGTTHAENYMAAYIGAAIPHDADLSDTVTGNTGTFGFNDGVALGAKLGFWAPTNPYIGAQADMNVHFPSLNTLTENGITAAVSSDMSVFSLTGNVMLRYPFGNIKPYVGAGGGWFHARISDGSVTEPGGPTSPVFDESDDRLGWQILAGVDMPLSPNMSVFGEYKYSAADFNFDANGFHDVKYRVSQIYIGAAFHF
jgi:outer membrane autotransporter protein